MRILNSTENGTGWSLRTDYWSDVCSHLIVRHKEPLRPFDFHEARFKIVEGKLVIVEDTKVVGVFSGDFSLEIKP